MSAIHSMDVELQDAPWCCRQSLDRICKLYEDAGCLAELLAVAPSLTFVGPRVTVIGILWRIAKGYYDWKRRRKVTTATVAPILRNRIQGIIVEEIGRHQHDPQLSRYWERLYDQLLH